MSELAKIRPDFLRVSYFMHELSLKMQYEENFWKNKLNLFETV